MRQLGLVLLAALPASAEGEPSLKELLEGYGREMSGQGFSNTIPVEQAILRARDAGDFASLAEFAGDERFGSEILWALGEARKEEGKALEAFGKLPLSARADAALSVAAYRSDAARTALANVLAAPDLDEACRGRIEAALLRAGEPKPLAAAKAALQAKDAERVADALLLLGDARASEFLEEALRRASDGTKLKGERRSQFPEVTTSTAEDGTTTQTTTQPLLATVGEAALEAASRMVASTTPEQMAWWCDVERGPRFARGDEGAKLLRQWIAEDRKARKAKAVGAEEALLAVTRALRQQAPEDPIEMRLVSVAFDKAWTIRYRLGDAEDSAMVDAAGKLMR